MPRLPLVMVFAVSVLVFAGCAVGNAGIDSPATADMPRQERVGGMVTVEGVLTNEGIECQALRGEDGTLYTLSRRPEGFKIGDRVLVTGSVAGISFCMQGTTINVTRIEKAED